MKFIYIFSKIFFGSILTVFTLAIVITVLISCQKAPVLQDGEIYSCFNARDCAYRNQKDTSKCIDEYKECRAKERYVWCNQESNRWERQDAQSCWDKLNSK